MNGRVKKMLTLSMLLYGCFVCSAASTGSLQYYFCSPWDLNKMMFIHIFPLDPGCHLDPIYLILNSESKNVMEKIWRNSMWKYFLLIWKLFFVSLFQFFDMQTTISKEKAISKLFLSHQTNISDYSSSTCFLSFCFLLVTGAIITEIYTNIVGMRYMHVNRVPRPIEHD